ncbi:MAG: cysteine desulfurase [Nanoarchaeota archaeon]|nr:cysteine desulfurase [Nanoarchaeota archaeon]
MNRRSDFPILNQKVHGKPLVYFDNAATTQKPRLVLDAMNQYYEHTNANVHRGVHALAEAATEAYEQAHRTVAKFISAPGMESIIFTRGTTESLNLLSYSLRDRLKKGDEIVLTRLEHHSNLIPWQQAAKATGATLKFLELTPTGELDISALDKVITDKTKIVTTTHVSNVLGTVVPVKQIADRAHQIGATMIVDAAQSVPHLPISVKKLGADFLAFSGHKMYGPTGIGVLFGTKDALTALLPFLFGGEMVHEVSYETSTWNRLPWKFEAGTPPIAEGVGLAAAIEYLAKLGMDKIAQHEHKITKACYDSLKTMDKITVLGPEERGSLVSFTVDGAHAHDVAALCDQVGVAVRAGHHCAMPLHLHLGIPASTRASFGVYSQETELPVLYDALEKAVRLFS